MWVPCTVRERRKDEGEQEHDRGGTEQAGGQRESSLYLRYMIAAEERGDWDCVWPTAR